MSGSSRISAATFTAWFKRNNAAAVLVRPDHYIYGLADGPRRRPIGYLAELQPTIRRASPSTQS